MFNRRIAIHDPFLNNAYFAITKVDRLLTRDFGEMNHLSLTKDQGKEFAKKTESRIAKIISENLLESYPSFGCFVEDLGWLHGSGQDYWWLIDPIDGTNNFIHGIPHFSISISLVFKSEIILGLTFDPIKDDLFYATKGKGAFLDNRRLRPPKNRSLDQSFILINNMHPFTRDNSTSLKKEKGFLKNNPGDKEKASLLYSIKQRNQYLNDTKVQNWHLNGATKRTLGSATLDCAYVACGRGDFFYGNVLRPWDIAAGILLINEAQGHTSVWECSRKIGEKSIFYNDSKIRHSDSWCLLIAHNNAVDEFKQATKQLQEG